MTRTRRALVGILLGTTSFVTPVAVSDVPPQEPPNPLQWHTCKPTLAYVAFGNDFEVKCDAPWVFSFPGAPPGKADYTVDHFAIATSKADWVAQAMATVHTAQIAKTKVKIHFRFAAADNPTGCSKDDCRAMVGIGVTD